MSSYDQKIKVKVAYQSAAKEFFAFLKAVGRKYPRPVKIGYKYLGRGYFYVTVDGNPGGIDSLFQELILNRGLYYYFCALKQPRRRDIIRYAIIPIFQGLIEERFPNPYSKFLRRHIFGKVFQEQYTPGFLSDPLTHEYEILFRKWDIKSIDDRGFVIEADSLLTRFMLTKLGHRPGERSPKFQALASRFYAGGFGMMRETKDRFNDLHTERTHLLHRLKIGLTNEQLSDLAFSVYNYFEYFNEFQDSQKIKTAKLHGRRYRRIKYGDEEWLDEDNEPYRDEAGRPYDWAEISRNPCHDCAAIRGQFHCEGCDVEQCPRCGGQFLGCRCKLIKDFD